MRVVLADDRIAVRSALRFLLENEPKLRVIGDAGEARALLGLLQKVCPDVVLLDWGLPGCRPEELVPELRALCPRVRLVVLSGRPEAARAALAAGADAFVSKGDPPEQLLAALQAVAPRCEPGACDEGAGGCA